MDSTKNIMTNRLDRGFYKYQTEFEAKALEVLRSGWYILGKEVSAFETEFADYIGTKYCVGVASGLDALWIAFHILGIGKGDEVIVNAAGKTIDRVTVDWNPSTSDCKFVISVTDGGGQFIPVLNGRSANGIATYRFAPVKASEVKVSITGGTGFIDGIYLD